MKIILTGANGFLGKAICNHFSAVEIVTLGRKHGSIVADLGDEIPSLPSCDLVIHAAGKAHSLPKTESERKAFTQINVIGTKNLLCALEQSPKLPKYFVFISSIAVYGEQQGNQIDENHPLNATDAYGKSKIEAEALIIGWCKQNNIICSILRLPLLAGENPPGNLQIMINAINKGYYFNVGLGSARRSMVMIGDVAQFIERVFAIGGTYNLTDGYHPSFRELSLVISKQVNKREPLSLPYGMVKVFAILGDLLGAKAPINSGKFAKMTKSLTFSDQKARDIIGWDPRPVVKTFTI